MSGTIECLIENYPDLIPYECIEKIPEQMRKYICKIIVGENKGTGFFLKIPFPDRNNMMTVFITNNHILNRGILYKKGEKIQIDIKEENDPKYINLDNRIKYTSDENEYDITIFQIKEEDNINNYLELDDIVINDIITKNNNKNKEFIGETIYIIHYPKHKSSLSFGILKSINLDKKSNFSHLCSTEKGSSGAPILNLNNKVIGIHKSGDDKNFNYNHGTFLNDPIKAFINLHYKKSKNEVSHGNSKNFGNSINKLFNKDKFADIKNLFKENNILKKKSIILKYKDNKKQIIKLVNIKSKKYLSPPSTPKKKERLNIKYDDNSNPKTEKRNFHLNRNAISPVIEGKNIINPQNYDFNQYNKSKMNYPEFTQFKNKLKEDHYLERINSSDNVKQPAIYGPTKDDIIIKIKKLNENEKWFKDNKGIENLNKSNLPNINSRIISRRKYNNDNKEKKISVMNKSMNYLEFTENEYSFMDYENYENIKYSQNNLGN